MRFMLREATSTDGVGVESSFAASTVAAQLMPLASPLVKRIWRRTIRLSSGRILARAALWVAARSRCFRWRSYERAVLGAARGIAGASGATGDPGACGCGWCRVNDWAGDRLRPVHIGRRDYLNERGCPELACRDRPNHLYRHPDPDRCLRPLRAGWRHHRLHRPSSTVGFPRGSSASGSPHTVPLPMAPSRW